MDAQTADETVLKRLYLSLLPHNALEDLILSLDAGATSSLFPADLAAEVKRLQAANEATNGADLDADGEGSPDPQPAPSQASRAPSMPPTSGPRTRAGAARAYAASLATSKDTPSARPSPAPGGISFPSASAPEPSSSSFAPAPQPYSPLVVHLPGASSPSNPGPSTPLTPAPVTGPPPNPVWQSPVSDQSTNGNTGPIRSTSVKKTKTGVVGGYNPITSIGPSSEGLPSYEEMIVLAIMESQNPEGVAPKDVFAWMSARWPLNANFRPSASQALQKAYKRGRLEKVGAKYKLNPNWHGGATTNRTTRRPQSMAELPGNYAWAPPPVAPVQSVPPDPRARGASSDPQRTQSSPAPPTLPANPDPSAPSGTGSEFDPQVHVANLLQALQHHQQTGEHPGPGPVAHPQAAQEVAAGGQAPPMHMPHLTMPQAGSSSGPEVLPSPPGPPAGAAPPIVPPTAQGPIPITAPSAHGMPTVPVPVPIPGTGVSYPGYHAPTPLQASLNTLAAQLANMSQSNQGV